MAYLVRRGPDRVEIRESVTTERGPRSRRLASFRAPLTPDVLDRAAAVATRPFDREAIVRRARADGIAVAHRAREPEARALLTRLRRRDAMDPTLATLLRSALERAPREPLPESLEDVAEWIGATAAERGSALRQLLDLYGRIAASRRLPRELERPAYPRIESSPAR